MNLLPQNKSLRSLSLRDPSGTLFEIGTQLIRQIHSSSSEDWNQIKRSPTLKKFTEKGLFVRSWEITDADISILLPELSNKNNNAIQDIYLGHEKIDFVNYPSEWAPEMLREAGLLTLDLATELSAENLGLKDATPFNVLFSGCLPVFVDVLSVEKRDPHNSLWLAYSQFSKTFVNPLLAYQHLGQPLYKTFLLSREGLTATDFYTQISFLKKLNPSLFTKITLPAILESWSDKKLRNHPNTEKLMNPERAQFTLQFLLKNLKKSISQLNFNHKPQNTQFNNYMSGESPYSHQQFESKERLVKKWLAIHSRKSVLDVGCNDGHFSRIAASLGRKVVAIDSEVELISKTWSMSRISHPTLLPLVVNIANPSPASGWRNQEHRSFLDRTQGQFDCVLMLALVHHLLTTESILLQHIIELAKELTTEHVIIEWVSPLDPMFQHLKKGRDYTHLTVEVFEQECLKHFTIIEKETLPGNTRTLYCLKKLFLS